MPSAVDMNIAANLRLTLRPMCFLVQGFVSAALVLVTVPYVHESMLLWSHIALVADGLVAPEGRRSWPGPACSSTTVAFLCRHLAGAHSDRLIAQSTAEWISKVYRFFRLWQFVVLLLNPIRVAALAATSGGSLSDQCRTTGQVTTRAPGPGTSSNRVEKRQTAKSKAGPKASAKSKGRGKAAAAKSRLPLEDRKDDDESEDDHDSDTGEHPEGSRSTEARLMACPYYKMDPIQNYRCVEKHKLDGFNRLKQHIERCHSTTLYYCPICWVKFKDAEARDGHIRSEGCEAIVGPEDFTVDEITRLQNNLPRGLPDHDKWYWVWDNFFAAHPRPESPYVYEGIREPLSLLTSIAKRNANSQQFRDWLVVQLRMSSSEHSTYWDDVIGQLLTLCHEHTPLSRRSPSPTSPPPPRPTRSSAANAPLVAMTHGASSSHGGSGNMSLFPQPFSIFEPIPHDGWVQSLQMNTLAAPQAAPEPQNPGSSSTGGHDDWNMAPGGTQSTDEAAPDPMDEFMDFL